MRREALIGQVGRAVIVLGLAVASAACSISFPIASLVPEDEKTGSIRPQAASPLHPDLGAEDWRRARAALGVALDPQGSGALVNWDNPETGLRGHFTPVGQPFVRSDEICRAFLATVVGQASTAALQGTACRTGGEDWALRDVKPWRRAG